ncbi:MAG: glycosyltransferase family 2 protein, partial [Myxococcales bacterium]
MARLPVSVLLPVRNAEPWLEEALGSLRAQTFPDYELIAVDDGSTDRSAAILARAAAEDPRIRVVPGPAKGISAALNAGLVHCTGELVARMDADDVALPKRFERQLA